MSPVPLLSFVGGLFPEARLDYFFDLHKWRTGLFIAMHIRGETGAGIYVYRVLIKVFFLLMAFLSSITVDFLHRGCYSKRSALSDSYFLKPRLTFAI